LKPVPPQIAASAPEGTAWFGGPVDRIKISLRVLRSEPSDHLEISTLLQCQPDYAKGVWKIHGNEILDGNLDAEIRLLLNRLTSDLNNWKSVTARWKVDLFCGLFLERANRGVQLSPESLGLLSERCISLGLDIYAPDENANCPPDS